MNDKSCENCYFNLNGICEDFDGLYFLQEVHHQCPDYLPNTKEYTLNEVLTHLGSLNDVTYIKV